MRVKNVVYWTLLIFLAATFMMIGVNKLTAMDQWRDQFVNQWNLPGWLVPVTGVAEILGGLMLLVPRLTPVGAAVIVVVMLGATGSHALAGEWSRIGVTVVFGLVAVQVLQWSLRRSRVAAETSGTED